MTPSGGNSNLAALALPHARSMSVAPKPALLGGVTVGPAYSRQVSSTLGLSSSTGTQLILTRPPSLERAPYLTALVASSCSANANGTKSSGLKVVSGPLIS